MKKTTGTYARTTGGGEQPPNALNLGPLQVTPQEIQAFRQKLPPNQANTSDEQLRTFKAPTPEVKTPQ